MREWMYGYALAAVCPQGLGLSSYRRTRTIIDGSVYWFWAVFPVCVIDKPEQRLLEKGNAPVAFSLDVSSSRAIWHPKFYNLNTVQYCTLLSQQIWNTQHPNYNIIHSNIYHFCVLLSTLPAAQVQVRAVNEAGAGCWSEPHFARTPRGKPQTFPQSLAATVVVRRDAILFFTFSY